MIIIIVVHPQKSSTTQWPLPQLAYLSSTAPSPTRSRPPSILVLAKSTLSKAKSAGPLFRIASQTRLSRLNLDSPLSKHSTSPPLSSELSSPKSSRVPSTPTVVSDTSPGSGMRLISSQATTLACVSIRIAHLLSRTTLHAGLSSI